MKIWKKILYIAVGSLVGFTAMRNKDTLMKELISLILFVVWIAGVVIAKGFWSTFFAIFIPFWSYYLVVEQLIVKFLL